MISYTCEHECHGKEGITQSFRDDQGKSLGPEDLATLWKAEYDRATTAFDEISKFHNKLQAFHEADNPSYYPTGDRKITIHHLSLLTEANYGLLFPAEKLEYGTTGDPDVERRSEFFRRYEQYTDTAAEYLAHISPEIEIKMSQARIEAAESKGDSTMGGGSAILNSQQAEVGAPHGLSAWG